MITALVIEDERASEWPLGRLLSASGEFRVLGSVASVDEILNARRAERPQVIVVDAGLRHPDSLTVTRRIMEQMPTPVVIVSSQSMETDPAAFGALDAGALAVVTRPNGPTDAAALGEMVNTARLMAEVKVVHRLARCDRAHPAHGVEGMHASQRSRQVIAVGASTGGPLALQSLLRSLPKDLPAPILVVQHMAPGFAESFVDWLSQATRHNIELAQHEQRARSGHVYLAPDGAHLGVSAEGRLALSDAPPEHGLRPAVAFLFRSIAQIYGAAAIGVLLTGMGVDGAAELGLMRKRGALTIAQDAASSVVSGMPGEAIRLGAADHVLPPEGIAELLRRQFGPCDEGPTSQSGCERQ
jgi:two-component system, chemotaxis family, protein-glutamate methylesterase/glutaminase